jgi:transposase InsO family protein
MNHLDRGITAKHPNHVWHVDLTTIPTQAGFWVPWLPMAMPQCWPFCWWIAGVSDHYSRRIVGFRLFKSPPTSRQITAFLDRLIRPVGQTPKYVISDKGPQFWSQTFKQWCKRNAIRSRFGAVGKYGSIAVIERMFRSLKSECTRQILVPIAQSAMLRELDCYASWFNTYRPHQGLEGMTPAERQADETQMPAEYRRRRNSNLQPLTLDVEYFKERKHLPIVRLRPAA